MEGLILYAPNVHTGGGMVLLRGLLDAWPADAPLRAVLDARARGLLPLTDRADVFWVDATLKGRWRGEQALARLRKQGDVVLCFHGLPPLLAGKGRVRVFLQNRNYLGLTPLRTFPFKTRLRIAFERAVSRVFRRRVDEYWVQTHAMARDLAIWWKTANLLTHDSPDDPLIRVLPFMPTITRAGNAPRIEWDFLYVADGVAHKNHERLLQAWSLLAARGYYPLLALTLSERDGELVQLVQKGRAMGLKIVNLGQMSHESALQLYLKARAVIFPSFSESFGLPLAEAHFLGVPILASEMDYVYEVCQPVQTFNPYSSESISRAVMRFMGVSLHPIEISTPVEFLEAVSK